MKLRCSVCGSAVERVPVGRWACIECGVNYNLIFEYNKDCNRFLFYNGLESKQEGKE